MALQYTCVKFYKMSSNDWMFIDCFLKFVATTVTDWDDPILNEQNSISLETQCNYFVQE